MKIQIQKELLERFPNIAQVVVIAKGVNVESSKSREIIQMLREAEESVREKVGDGKVEDLEGYKEWAAIYKDVLKEAGASKKLGKKMIPTHLALANRAAKGEKIPNINPLVNFYNALSLKWGVPFGVEDLATYYGDISLRYATGDEKFVPIGGSDIEEALKGEVVWVDDHSVTCRMWGWRQSERTKITKESRDTITFVDIVNWGAEGAFETIEQLVGEYAKGLEEYFGAEVEWFVLRDGEELKLVDYETKSIKGVDIEKDLEKYLVSKAAQGSKGIRKRKPEPMVLSVEGTFLDSLEKELLPYFPDAVDRLGLHYSPKSQEGEVSSTAGFKYAQQVRKSPQDAGEELVEHVKSELKGVVGSPIREIFVAENGFINISLSDSYLLKSLQLAVGDLESFGKSGAGGGKRILVESPGWNPNKTPHVGHMLNLFLGKALIRLFEQVGFEALNDDIVNDKGLPVMQTIWAYGKYGNGSTPSDTGDKADHFVHRYYAIGKKKYNESDKVKEEVKEILRKWESGDSDVRAIWEQVVNWAYKGQRETVNRVWEEVGHVWYESDVYAGGKAIVQKHIGKGVVEKLPDGAVVARIEQEYGLPDPVLIKSDGTGLYHTQDIFLALKKKEKFDPWRMVWVVAEEQVAHFQRLFAVLDALEIMPIDNLYHFAYSWVVGKDGKKLSSRDGGELGADELLDMMHERAREVLAGRESDMSESELEKIAESVAIGAFKYALLSRDPFKQIKFDPEESLSFTGKSGPYIMYAYTRAHNVLEKGGVGDGQLGGVDVRAVVEGLDVYTRNLLVQLLRYPEVVISAASNYSPGVLAEYMYECAKAFSSFYENVSVLNAEGNEREVLLNVVRLTAKVLEDGLRVLGVKVLSQM